MKTRKDRDAESRTGRRAVMINPDAAIQQRLALGFGLDRYAAIMRRFPNVDVSKDRDFQRLFNGFYRVRRNETWRDAFYALFQRVRDARPTFEEIVTALYDKTGRVEASFASKMLATLDADKPIWDKYALINLGIAVPDKNKDAPLTGIADAYDQIEGWYASYLTTPNARRCVRSFDRLMPDYSWISATKKIDFYLWSMR